MAMDGTHTILVHMRLYADRFDEFFCSQKIILGVDFVNFNKMVKQIKNEDSLVLFMEKSNLSRLGIRIMNGEKQMVTTKYLNLMELDIKPIEIPPVQFPEHRQGPAAAGRQGGNQVGGKRTLVPTRGRRIWQSRDHLRPSQETDGNCTGVLWSQAPELIYKVHGHVYGHHDVFEEQLSHHH
jgi:hypothetical protein